MARTILEFEYNRNRGVKMTPLEVSFLTGDKNGHEFHVRIVDKEGPVDLSGCVVKGMFIADDRGREDDITVDLTGRVDGNNAILPLKEECYALTGRFSLAIKVGRGDDTLATVFWATGNVLRSGTEQRTVPETLTYLPVNGKAADAAKLDGKAPEYYIQLENQLDNSDFEVAQAGYNGLHGNELYHADRWWGNGIGSLSVSGTVKTFASISGFAIMKQNLWNDGRDHGKTYTLVVTLPDGTRLVGSGKEC